MFLEEDLKSIRKAIDMAIQAGFSSNSSPIDFLFEASIDILLSLANQLQIGGQTRKENKRIIPTNKVDELANQKILSLPGKRTYYYDPPAAEYLKKVIQNLIAIKRQSFSPYMGEKQSTPPRQKPKSLNANKQKSERLKNQRRKGYHRRKVKHV